MTIIIAIIVLLAIVAFFFFKRMSLLGHLAKIQDLEANIDNDLFERYETFTQLINIMDKYFDTEQTTLREVKLLQEKALKSREEDDERSWVGDEDKISRHVEGLEFTFEQHEDLQKDPEAKRLFELLIEEEGDLAALKMECNNSIQQYNEAKHTLFGSMVAFVFGSSLNQEFELWHVNADAINGRDKYQLELK